MAEERRGLEQLTMSASVNGSRAWQLSSHIHNMCKEAREAIYTTEADVKHWLAKGQGLRFFVYLCDFLVILGMVLFSHFFFNYHHTIISTSYRRDSSLL